MILFLFEGKRREPDLFETLQKLFFPKKNDRITCSFGNNIYQLYKELREYGGDGDLVSILKEKYSGREDNPLKDIERSSDFSEIYLFFDYDFHNRNLSLEELNKQVSEMLTLFNDETENGKLYINYPMVESIRYTKELPDAEYYSYTVNREECSRFKHLSSAFSGYKSFDFIQAPDKRKLSPQKRAKLLQNWKYLKDQKICKANFCTLRNFYTAEKETISPQKRAELLQNWQYLKDQNVCKANFICTGQNVYTAEKETISQLRIFEEQKNKYVSQEPCCVAILNSFPLFLYDYFK
jgi:hypothetical protein